MASGPIAEGAVRLCGAALARLGSLLAGAAEALRLAGERVGGPPGAPPADPRAAAPGRPARGRPLPRERLADVLLAAGLLAGILVMLIHWAP